MTVKVINIPWHKEEDYVRLKNLFTDGHNLPDTFDDWFKEAQGLCDDLRSNGHIIEKVYIDPDAFPAWCRSRGLDIDAHARADFAGDFVARKYIK